MKKIILVLAVMFCAADSHAVKLCKKGTCAPDSLTSLTSVSESEFNISCASNGGTYASVGTPSGSGAKCWCQLKSGSAGAWVYNKSFSSDSGCVSDCVSNCAKEAGKVSAFRSALCAAPASAASAHDSLINVSESDFNTSCASNSGTYASVGTPSGSGAKCWCQLKSGSAGAWVYNKSFSSDSGCGSDCASSCASDAGKETAFSSALYAAPAS